MPQLDDRPVMEDDELRHARHNLRGRLNALKLCISALEILESREERLEFLDLIETAADRLLPSLDELEAVYDRVGRPEPSRAAERTARRG
jgi:hypothetical protein